MTRTASRPAPPCRRAACTADCAGHPGATVGPVTRARRWCALAVALAVGLTWLGLVLAVPGPGRIRRTARARTRGSRWVLRALGVRREVTGAPRSGPSLVVGNHLSFLDILALSAGAPMLMVAKSEVAGWPVIGWAARSSGSIFLRRDSLHDLPRTVDDITAALRSGHRVQVFPEGTTRCGTALDPFRRAAFQAAIDAAVVVSPVTVRYRDASGASTAAAFVGDESLLRCLRRVVASRELVAEIHWLVPVPAIAGTGRRAVDRRTVTTLVESAVARDLGIPVLHRDVARRGRPGLRVLPGAPRAAAAVDDLRRLDDEAAGLAAG
ncbi:lysophospholipid acyltransferase family protein [Nakamurella alba]|uniref:lysophospholipid acyltransferase family protein n=1 Tax=Nakamurella alba TaxID=2665158 RepID=UPI0018A92ADC|nr:lysophospholipid acyltransferase family protein [Nakamurella alba]